MLENLILVLDRQGKFKGDLNVVQRTGLFWLMNHEVDETVEVEMMRIKHQALASNANTSPEYIKSLFKEPEQEEPDEDAPVIEIDEWETPQTPQDLEKLLSRLNSQTAQTAYRDP